MNGTQTRWSIGIGSEFAVIGHNPEMADMSNPRGAIVREVFFAVAEDHKGYRRTWADGVYRSAEEAEAAFQFAAPPVSEWNEWHPAYGSQAYIESDEESNLAAWEKDVDQFWGAAL
jgi:hypothetical protein